MRALVAVAAFVTLFTVVVAEGNEHLAWRMHEILKEKLLLIKHLHSFQCISKFAEKFVQNYIFQRANHTYLHTHKRVLALYSPLSVLFGGSLEKYPDFQLRIAAF